MNVRHEETRVVLQACWDGAPAPDPVEVALRPTRVGLRVACAAPLWSDAGPPGPPGPTPKLWEHDVVELFVLGGDGSYLEVELGPFGNHLVLQLAGYRAVQRQGLPLRYVAAVRSGRGGRRWAGVATVPWRYFPPLPHQHNVYAIVRRAEERSYLARFPVPGPAPDFHRLPFFRPVDFYGGFLPGPLAEAKSRA